MEKEKDGHKAIQRRYEEKVKPYSELEVDAGGLGKTGAGYEEKQRAGHGLHSPRDGMAEAQESYTRKQQRGEK